MIIEFTGLPGVGKSFILEKIKRQNENKNIVFLSKKRTYSYIFYEIALYLFSIPFFFLYPRTAFQAVTYSLNCDENIFTRINIFRNTIKKFGERILSRVFFNSKIVIIDEGLSHLPMNYFFNKNLFKLTQNEKKHLKILPMPDIVLLVESEKSDNIQRLIERGHKRLPTTNEKELSQIVDSGKLIIKFLKDMVYTKTYFITINNSNNKDYLNDLGFLEIVDKLNKVK